MTTDGQTVEIQLLTNGNNSTTKHEAVGRDNSSGTNTRRMISRWPSDGNILGKWICGSYIPGKNWTIEQTMENGNILNFVYPGQSIRIAPKRDYLTRNRFNGDLSDCQQKQFARRNP